MFTQAFPHLGQAHKQDVVYKIVDNLDISLTFWAPRRANDTELPAFLIFHPGGLTGGNRFSRLPEYLIDEALKRNIIAVTADYRLLPQSTSAEIYQDCMDAFAFVGEGLNRILTSQKLPEIDRERIGVVGLSAGGWCAAVVANQAGIRFPVKAIFSLYGMLGLDAPYFNTYRPEEPIFGLKTPTPEELEYLHKLPPHAGTELVGFIRTKADKEPVDEQQKKQLLEQNTYCIHLIHQGQWANVLGQTSGLSEKLRGCKSYQERREVIPERFAHFFPLLYATKNHPPAVLMHGTGDTATPCEDSQFWHDQLKDLGVDSTVTLVQGAQHGFDYDAVNADDNEMWTKYLKSNVDRYLNLLTI